MPFTASVRQPSVISADGFHVLAVSHRVLGSGRTAAMGEGKLPTLWLVLFELLSAATFSVHYVDSFSLRGWQGDRFRASVCVECA